MVLTCAGPMKPSSGTVPRSRTSGDSRIAVIADGVSTWQLSTVKFVSPSWAAWRLVGMVIGFTGVAMLAWDGASFKAGDAPVSPGVAVIFCLLASICYGLSAAATKRYLGGLPSLVAATGSQCGATLALALPAWLYWPAQMPGLDAWSAAIMAGVLCTGIAYVLYFRLLENAGPSRALSVTFVIPVFAVIYGAVFLGEPITARMLLCGVVIVFGTALSTGLLLSRRNRQ